VRSVPPHRSGPVSPRATVRVLYGCPHAWPLAETVTLADIARGRYHDCWKPEDHAGPHRCHCGAITPTPEEDR
jgi:hypothetical protein